MEQGTTIALDITAANAPNTIRDINILKDAGYTVHVVHADVEVDEAVASALLRAGEGAITSGRLGRVVPVDYIRGMQDETNGTDRISVAFPDYAEKTNGSVHWFRNFPLSGRSEGRKPVYVWNRGPIPHQPTLQQGMEQPAA